MRSTRQLRTIHYLHRLLAVGAEERRWLLCAYPGVGGGRAETGSRLSAADTAAHLRALQWLASGGGGDRAPAQSAGRRQQARIYALWRGVARTTTPARRRRSLDRYLQRRFGTRAAAVLWRGRISTVVRQLTAMRSRARGRLSILQRPVGDSGGDRWGEAEE